MSTETWSDADQTVIQTFLASVCGLLPTGQITFRLSEKNRLFDEKFNMRHLEKVALIKSLTVSDCIKIAENENGRFPDAKIFIFKKSAELNCYGESCKTMVYIKMYIAKQDVIDYTVVISFHEDGIY